MRTFVVDDPISPWHHRGALPKDIARATKNQPYIIVPLAYAHDEPIEQILEAARLLPGMTLVLTGRAPAALKEQAPPNVKFTGYLTTSDYQAALANARAVLALTTEEWTMQCAGYEALSCGLPLVTSPTKVLREYFGQAALYAAPEANSIKEALITALSDESTLRAAMIARRDQVLARQSTQLQTLKDFIASGVSLEPETK